MKTLHTKYLENKLSPEELVQFKEALRSSSDEEIAREMQEKWQTFEDSSENVPSERIKEMKKRLNREFWPQNHISLLGRLLRIAVVLLIPLLIVTSFYFYRQATVVATSDMIITAGKGERVSVTLPDGTTVRINAQSTLRYNPLDFNKKDRRIRFEGEAFFDVETNPEVPFIISTPEMNLQVLGTKFNLLSRDYSETIEVSLQEGHVLLSSLLSKNKQELFSNQKAFLSKSTGQFIVVKEKEKTSTAWLDGHIVFKNKPLNEVVKAMETTFDVSFRFVNCDALGRDLFTGSFSTRNLDEALDILQKSYGFSYMHSEKEIVVYCE